MINHSIKQPVLKKFSAGFALAVLALAAWLPVNSVRAGTHTWTGAGGNVLWSTAANWTGGAPAFNETPPVVVIFNTTVATSNNIALLFVDSLQFWGDSAEIHGSGSGSLTLRGGNSSTNLWFKGNFNSLREDLLVGFSGTNLCVVGLGNFATIHSALSGSGEVIWDGGGQVTYLGTAANTLSGTTRLRDAFLNLNKTAGVNAIAGPLVMDDSASANYRVELKAANQIADSVTVTIGDSKQLFAFSFNETIAALNLRGGSVALINGLLTLGGNVNVNTNGGQISSPLSLGGVTRSLQVASNAVLTIDDSISDGGPASGFSLTGGGKLILQGTNTFTGAVAVTNSILQLDSNLALGSSAAGTLIDTNSTLMLNGVTVTNELLTLAGNLISLNSHTNFLGGAVVLQAGAECDVQISSQVTLSGAISGAGALLKTSVGTLILAGSAANTYSGGTEIQNGTLLLSKTNTTAIPGALKFTTTATAKTVRLIFSEQIANSATVTLTNSSTLDFNNNIESISALVGSSTNVTFPAVVALGTGTLTNGVGSGSGTFGGSITGSGTTALVKVGGGTCTLTGSNTCTGITRLNLGTLTVNGTLPGAVTTALNTYLTGTGTVGAVTCNSGYLQPGVNAPGTLNTGNLIISNSSSVAFMELGTLTNDVFNVIGSVNIISNAQLDVVSETGGSLGKKFTLIANDGTDAVVGTFSGLPEGATISYGALQYTISYQGGSSSNDVVLTQTAVPAKPQINSITKQISGQMQVLGRADYNFSYELQGCTNLAAPVWLTLDTQVPDLSSNLTFLDTNAASFKQRYYRFKTQ